MMDPRLLSLRALSRVTSMARSPASLVMIGALSLPLSASGSSETHETDTSASSDGDTATASDSAAADTASDTTSGGAPKFVAVCDEAKACSTGKMCVDGVCAPEPGPDDKTALRDASKDNIATSTGIDLSCVGVSLDDVVKDLPKDQKAVMWGRVDRFGGGGITTQIEVAVFRATDFHPEACAGIEDPIDAQDCYRDPKKVGTPLATAVSIDPTEAVSSGWDVKSLHAAEEECDKGVHLQCPSGYVCDKVDGWVKCAKNHGIFAVEDVPLNTPLILRTRAVNPANSNGWHDAYTWDVVLLSTHLDEKGEGNQPSKYIGKDTVRFNPTIVGEGQWQLVPSTIGVVGGIYEGDGVIGGRIRDCGTQDRRSWPILDAKVGFGVQPEGLSYFNDSELDPVPAKNRTTTNIIGRYAAVGVPPGPNRVAVTGRVDGTVRSLGSADVYVIPNALVIVSLPGLTPYNNK